MRASCERVLHHRALPARYKGGAIPELLAQDCICQPRSLTIGELDVEFLHSRPVVELVFGIGGQRSTTTTAILEVFPELKLAQA